TLPPATPYTTAEMSLSFVRRVPRDSSQLSSTARVVHTGNTIGIAEGAVVDDSGRLVATCSTRCVVLPKLAIDVESVPADNDDSDNEPDWPTPHPFERDVAGTIVGDDQLQRMTGLDALRASIRGDLGAPPITHLCGIVPREADEGRTVWTMPASEWLCSPVQGRLYGGAIAYLASTALDGTAQSVARSPLAFAPVDMKVYFPRPVPPDGSDLIATGTLVSRGRTVVIATADVRDSNGKAVALAIGSAMLQRVARMQR
ncbi:MAG: PaaI family thioesterase, partial [Candidatus Dormibacteria bacterium]